MTALSAQAIPDADRLGITRRVSRICDEDGLIRVLAIDHLENYLALLDPDITKVSFDEVVRGHGTPAWRPAQTDEATDLVPPDWHRTQAGPTRNPN